ncbi:unnamed protein product [Triticum turgidum subsp. durum]|uniref:CAAX prenyl protease 2/Lysostaphin resistance protein A-like domain-containing protein n=1 Tax=Triticum turgidum subsp. durum TaxID=4567 RepID=A0A9R1BKI0_TRITD|nr:unnamed protein product [Triticum turgidum subsp. durum]
MMNCTLVHLHFCTILKRYIICFLYRFSTPVSVLITAVVFAFAHLTPGEFPQLFVLGVALGFSYSQTRNLLTPITIHAAWNSGVILLLTFLQVYIIFMSPFCCTTDGHLSFFYPYAV